MRVSAAGNMLAANQRGLESVAEEVLQPGRTRPAPDTRVRAAVVEAIAAGRGAGGGRSTLTGLWLAAIATLIEAGEPADVMAVLLDRAATVRGQGRNADAPPLQEDAEARARRSAEATLAARAIVDALAPLPVSAEDDFPERLLDVAVALLAEAWGPAHLRRALWEQRVSLEEGSHAVILPTEPSVSNGGRVRPSAEAAAGPGPVPGPAPVLPAPDPISGEENLPDPGPARTIELHADAALLGPGRVAYALCARIRQGGMQELREVTGTLAGISLRAAVLQAVAGLLVPLPPSLRESVRVATPIEGVLRLADGADPEGEEGVSALLAAIRSGRAVEWGARAGGLGGELGRRCDRALRDRIDEEAAAAA